LLSSQKFSFIDLAKSTEFQFSLRNAVYILEANMGVFNQAEVPWTEPTTKNVEGGGAYTMSPSLELVSILLTAFIKSNFYKSKEAEMERAKEIVNALNAVDPLFAAKAAVYARNEFGMRSITHVVAGEIANMKTLRGVPWVAKFLERVARRPDDILEIMSYLRGKYPMKVVDGRPYYVTAAMRRGFGARLARFDEYQLAKYRSETKALTLVDAVNQLHPPKTEALGKLVRNELKNEHTFEARLSVAGVEASSAETEEQKLSIRADAWKELIDSGRLGYMALLKNLRNIAQQAPDSLMRALSQLQDEKQIRKSLVLPFRYWTAYQEIQKDAANKIRLVLPALSNAAEIALKNVPKLPGRTLVALDYSGSMEGRMDIATQFAAVLYKANDSDLIAFNTAARELRFNPADTVLTLQQNIYMNTHPNGGTSFEAAFAYARARGEWYDRFVFISDAQDWAGRETPAQAWKTYSKQMGRTPSMFVIDTGGLGTLNFPANKVYYMTGFSEKIFDIMSQLDEDRNALVNKIEAIQF